MRWRGVQLVMLVAMAMTTGAALPARAARQDAAPQFTIQIVPKTPAQNHGTASPRSSQGQSAQSPRARQTPSQTPGQPPVPAATPPAQAQRPAKSPPSRSQTESSAASQRAASPAGSVNAPAPAALARLEQTLAEQRAGEQRKAQLQQALEAARHIVVQAAGPQAVRPVLFVFVDYEKTPHGKRHLEEAQRRKERELLLQMLKEHVQQVELQGCELVETTRMFEYRFRRTARLSELDAYGVTYTRQDGGGFSFTLKSPAKQAVLFQQHRGTAQLSEQYGDEIVFRTTITDGMQAFVLKQRLQELINRCKLGNGYKAGADLPEMAATPMVRQEGPVLRRSE
ncbi:hypothetical protein [Megalodesulfovibrio gigas]|uniref:Uncharacterized protein n=1 Tax=Megalodesulfovibrio gigas (strain ATCC 19364 / DSM 1382 / NCIMB 9332 / VKM B-1759) TaxID=1121448 RepID=T2GD54_MEGG1|nr:hypothetical protein [Megalodesulfovibrio gigas]AGW14084.1 hypothetical protein DGI_2331 [Megalodesulfovibrio gigas DSM 1382 = ATCC 19364]